MIASPLLEAGEDKFNALFIKRISFNSASILENDGVTVFKHANYYDQQKGR